MDISIIIMVQVYQGSLTCIRDSAEPLLSTFVNHCVTLFQTHQHPACLDILATCIELFGPQPTAANMLTHALYVSCSASEPVFSVSHTSNVSPHRSGFSPQKTHVCMFTKGLSHAGVLCCINGCMGHLFMVCNYIGCPGQYVQWYTPSPTHCAVQTLLI